MTDVEQTPAELVSTFQVLIRQAKDGPKRAQLMVVLGDVLVWRADMREAAELASSAESRQALAWYQAASRIDPRCEVAWFRLTTSEHALAEEKGRATAKLLVLDPKNALYHYLASRDMLAKQNASEAVAHLTRGNHVPFRVPIPDRPRAYTFNFPKQSQPLGEGTVDWSEFVVTVPYFEVLLRAMRTSFDLGPLNRFRAHARAMLALAEGASVTRAHAIDCQIAVANFGLGLVRNHRGDSITTMTGLAIATMSSAALAKNGGASPERLSAFKGMNARFYTHFRAHLTKQLGGGPKTPLALIEASINQFDFPEHASERETYEACGKLLETQWAQAKRDADVIKATVKESGLENFRFSRGVRPDNE
jgi:hypothetical protein